MSGKRNDRARSSRGSALIIALLVILVLTIVGLGVAYFTQLEDQTSGNIRLAKTAFYGAETGLRTGEQALTQANRDGLPGTALLNTGGTPFGVPGGGKEAIPLNISGVLFDKVVLTAAKGTTDVATFTLYIRNNAEDPGNNVVPVEDRDRIVNLISVGQIWSTSSVDGAGLPIPERLLATKILEEQIRLGAPGESVAPQEGVNESGTNTGQTGGNT
jgi:hypothetical protein